MFEEWFVLRVSWASNHTVAKMWEVRRVSNLTRWQLAKISSFFIYRQLSAAHIWFLFPNKNHQDLLSCTSIFMIGFIFFYGSFPRRQTSLIYSCCTWSLPSQPGNIFLRDLHTKLSHLSLEASPFCSFGSGSALVKVSGVRFCLKNNYGIRSRKSIWFGLKLFGLKKILDCFSWSRKMSQILPQQNISLFTISSKFSICQRIAVITRNGQIT